LKGCRAMESILEQQRAAHGGSLDGSLLKAKEEAAEALATGLEAFRHEKPALSIKEASALLAALMKLRAHAAASADFESLRIRLAETLERLHKPVTLETAAYDQQGGKQKTASALPTRLDKMF
jgi:hypothetical protein